MPAPASWCAARSLFPFPDCKVSHTSRDIKYVFLNGCKNIAPSHTSDAPGTRKAYKESVSCHPKVKRKPSTPPDSCFPFPDYLAIFFMLPVDLENQAKSPEKRLPVFRQLCGEAMPDMALADVHLQNSSQELTELPDTKARRADKKSWRMRQPSECSLCNKRALR